jgi:hypothetical protein
MLSVKLRDHFGEFATRRWDPGFDAFIKHLTPILKNKSEFIITLDGIKFMSISFFDEIFRRLTALGYDSKHFSKIRFSSTLEPHLLEHFQRLYLKTEKLNGS